MAEKLRKISEEELKVVLKEHKLWLESEGKKGKKADLSYTDLKEANLRKADLRLADLRKTDLQYADLADAKLYRVNFQGANLQNTSLQRTDLGKANLQMVNLKGANLEKAYLGGANFENAICDDGLKYAINVQAKYLPFKDIILDTESKIRDLEDEKKELEEKLQQASNITQEEKERFEQLKNKVKEIEQQLELANQTIQLEQEAKKKTEAQIETAVTYLKNPNTYITTQINIQYLLVGIYVLFTVFAIIVFKDNLINNYHTFKDLVKNNPTFITWLFYASPTILSFSLTIVFINQINARLQNIVRLNERKRYVDSVEGGLQAINALSINNEDARKKILDTMDKIIDHTLQSSEKANEPIVLEENSIEDPLSTLSKIKNLVK